MLEDFDVLFSELIPIIRQYNIDSMQNSSNIKVAKHFLPSQELVQLFDFSLPD